MIDLPTVVGIIMAFVSLVCGLWLTMKSMRRNEDRANAMSGETGAVMSEPVAGQSAILSQLTKSLELTDTTVETDKSIKASPRKAAKANHQRKAADFIPHQSRPHQHQEEIAA